MLRKLAYGIAIVLCLAGLILASGLWHRPQAPCGGGMCAQPVGIQGMTSYSWAGSVMQLTPVGPSPRYLAAAAFDRAHDDFVLFGGQTRTGTSGETWILDKVIDQHQARQFKWRQVKPVHSPLPRRGAAMAWDPRDHLVLMYGGLIPDAAEGTEASDTWAWDGVDWSQLADGSTAPGPRDAPDMVTAGDRVLLFGGHVANVRYYGDAWSWDGKRWVRADADPTPPGRGHAAAIWDPTAAALFIFGGSGARPDAGPGNLGTPLSDVWELKGRAWTQLPAGPPPIGLAAASRNPTSGAIVVSGVICPMNRDVFWEWNGATWRFAGESAQRMWGAAVAADADGYVMEFGGSNDPAC
jgi:hypothetical protein